MKSQKRLFVSSQADAELWHKRFGYINNDAMHRIKSGLVNGVNYFDNFDVKTTHCQICRERKQSRARETLRYLRTHFLLVIVDYSRMTFIYFLKAKSEMLICFKTFKLVENRQNEIKIFRTENICEYCSNEVENFLKPEGIVRQNTNPYTPAQNGLSERSNS